MKPIKIDDVTHQALKEYSVVTSRDMGEVAKDALMNNAQFKKTYDEVKKRLSK